MKLKSLILGSVAAAGLSTAGFAADLGVLTSLDVCDSLGLSGLTISSDTNCLQITGGVSYEFQWGDFRDAANGEFVVARTFDGNRNIPRASDSNDWFTKVEAWLQFVATADSDFGPAKAVIKIKEIDDQRTLDEGTLYVFPDDTGGLEIDEAYVSVGDATVLSAGIKGSIANLTDDEPFSFPGLFNSDAIDGKGVGIDADYDGLGDHSIQVVSDVGNGLKVGVALENLRGYVDLPTTDAAENAGTLVGVVQYAGESLTAHVTGMGFGVLDGDIDSWAVHAGATGSFDAFKVRGAVSYWDNFKFRDYDVLNALATAEASFDLFKIAISGEVADVSGAVDYTDYGFGGSIGAGITEGVSINLGARYFNDDLNDLETTQVALQLVASLTETIKMTGELGAYFGDGIGDRARGDDDEVYYGAAELAWTPGGNFSSSLKGEVYSNEAYRVTFKAAKSFE
jgi:hypothetical protein